MDDAKTTEPRGCPIPGACSALTEIERLRAERDKFERAWTDVSDRYEALLNQLGATDA